MLTALRSLRSLAVCSFALSMVVGCAASSDDIGSQSGAMTPTVVQGNPQTCVEVGMAGTATFKVEPVKSGTYTSADGKLTVTITATEKEFSFTSNIGLDGVIVKGGTAANVYMFGSEMKSGSMMVAPDDKGLSHLQFCYDIEVSTPPNQQPPVDQPPVVTPPVEEPPPEPCDDGEC